MGYQLKNITKCLRNKKKYVKSAAKNVQVNKLYLWIIATKQEK